MLTQKKLNNLLPHALKWAHEQEQYILTNGTPLSGDQEFLAFKVGVEDVKRIRILSVDIIPVPDDIKLIEAMKKVGLFSIDTIGMTFRYGIYIRSDFKNDKRLLTHELVHTLQYEILGFDDFLIQYLNECLKHDYPYGSLEKEAITMANKLNLK